MIDQSTLQTFATGPAFSPCKPLLVHVLARTYLQVQIGDLGEGDSTAIGKWHTLTTPARRVACGPPYLRLIGIVSISRRSGFSGAQGPLFFSELP